MQISSRGNPLTYEVDALRSLMLARAPSTYTLRVDFLVVVSVFIALSIVAAKLYHRVVI